MEYIMILLLDFSLIFFLSYYGMLFYHKVKGKSELMNNIIGGLIMAAVFVALSIVKYMSDREIMPDGRFLLTGFAAFYFGPVAGLITAGFSSLVSYVLYHNPISIMMLLQLFVIGLSTIFRGWGKRKGRHPKAYEIFLFLMVASAIIIFILYLLAKDKTLYVAGLRSIIILIPFQSLAITALLTVNYKEIERNELIQTLRMNGIELASRKSEIEALYEEVSANEEELRHNYDQLASYEERMEYLAFHENQTGFYNGEKLLEQLRAIKSNLSGNGGRMLMIGIDEAEKLERTIGIVLLDTLHYLVGIEVMTVFEELTHSQIYSITKGKFIALIGEEYTEADILEKYIVLRKRVMEPFVINTLEMNVNIAAGGLALTVVPDKPEQWIEQCEFAFHHASSDRLEEPGIMWFGEALMEKHAKNLQIEKELYKAIDQNELYLVYQPQFNNDRKIIGAEALLRWKHSQLGEIPPGIFIPIAEKNGLIDSIGKIVIKNTCNFISRNREFLEEGSENLPLAVNASFLELINPYFSTHFLEILDKFEISSDQIKVEITESEVSMHYKELSENLKQLNDAGIKVELDDFGTGYSSLQHLGNIQVQTVKIDKAFIDRILIDDKIGDLVEMIIDFAHRFKMKVIAEGVETESQFLWLKERNCDAYQGYYFAMPMAEERFLTQVQEHFKGTKE